MKDIIKKKLKLLNEERREENKPELYLKDLAQVVFQNDENSAQTRVIKFSKYLNGYYKFNTTHLRILRKFFGCSIDELLPISSDIDINV